MSQNQDFPEPTYKHSDQDVPPPEYRIRTVVRYVVTRYCYPYTDYSNPNGKTLNVPGGSSVVCEVAGEQGAFDIANALATAEGATVQGY